MVKTATASEILEALRTVLDLPATITALDLRLRIDEPPVIGCTFYPERSANG